MGNLITVIAFIECSLNTWFFLACCIHINAVLTSWYPTNTSHPCSVATCDYGSVIPLLQVSICECKTRALIRSISELFDEAQCYQPSPVPLVDMGATWGPGPHLLCHYKPMLLNLLAALTHSSDG